MRKLRQYYYANSKKIWKIIIIVAIVLLIIQMLNNKSKNNDININIDVGKDEEVPYNEISLKSNKEALTGNSYSEKNTTEINVIDNFFEYINKGNYKEAYSLITEECKNEMFSSEEKFISNYIDIIKEKGSNCIVEVEKWKENIYQVNISEDILSTGNTDALSIQDYITIQGDKLNINSFLGAKEISGEKNIGEFKIELLSEKKHMDYTIISFKINNNTNNKFILDELNQYDNMYLMDKKGYKYISYSNELTKSDVIIYPSEEKNLDIKYYLKHATNIELDKVVFKNILESDEIKNVTNETENVEINVKR